MDLESLTPLAALVQEKVYSFGTCLTREGATPEGMCIIFEGQCQVCSEDVATRINRLDASPKSILYSPNIEDITHRKEQCIQTDVLAYPQYYVFSVLSRKDHFAARMLFSNRQWEKVEKEAVTRSLRPESRGSFLSVVADSAIVKTLIIRKGMLEYIAKNIKRSIINRIKQFQDEDRPGNIKGFEKQKADMQKWETFKERLAIDILKGGAAMRKSHHP